jgi:hypothetical protein
MNEKITHEHVLLLVYGEASQDLQEKVMAAMVANPELMTYYNETIRTRKILDQIHEEPHPTSVAIVNEHSHDSHTEAV